MSGAYGLMTTRPATATRPRSICVLVPALNEVENLAPTVNAVRRALSETIEAFEIIIVDDHCTDGTARVADRLAAEIKNVRVFHNPSTRGIGYAYILGYENTTCSHFVYIPGDNTWPYLSCRKLFSALRQTDIVTSYAINPEVRPLSRRLLSPFYTYCLNLLFGHKMRYYNGLTIYPVSFLRTRPVTTFGFAFQAEALLKALAVGLSCSEIGLPIDERAAGSSKAISLRNIASVIATILRLRWELRASIARRDSSR
jgi:dolichol-phosphate mannosyltransferase